jgi:two-component system cell cycle sensor histidine kinase/response regulator CckA
MADGGQIDQVLINLATNARDAMPKGGTLTIQTSSFYIDELYAKKRMLKDTGLYAVISVSDTGSGIPTDILSNIFDPFFTTKEAGKGTGLGLSIVYGIVKGHNGDVRVYSEPDKGTVFKIYLPMVTKAIEQPDVCQPKTFSIEGNETILLAEDEEDVREILKISLESAGYKVIEAVNGEDAVNKAKAFEGKIELFLTDVIMPKMNGKDAYLAIKAFLPDIRVMFMSGYTADIIDRSLEGKEAAIQVVSKPISPRDLLLRVRECLDRPCGAVC